MLKNVNETIYGPVFITYIFNVFYGWLLYGKYTV